MHQFSTTNFLKFLDIMNHLMKRLMCERVIYNNQVDLFLDKPAESQYITIFEAI